jgi:hypothetical protein
MISMRLIDNTVSTPRVYIRGCVASLGLLAIATAALASVTATPPSPAKPADPARELKLQMGFLPEAPQPRARPADPLEPISNHMTDVVSDLSDLKTDEPVQVKQKQVVTDLDAIIEEMNKACNGSGSSCANPTRPLANTKIIGGPGGQGEMHDGKGGDNQWGQLPDKERDQILQAGNEGFPPGYEKVLAGYYQRLSQEKVADEAGDDGAKSGATQPAR